MNFIKCIVREILLQMQESDSEFENVLGKLKRFTDCDIPIDKRNIFTNLTLVKQRLLKITIA